MSLIFEWDPNKAAGNLRKHKVTFEEAATVFEDIHSVTIADPDHSLGEDRYLIIGASYQNRLLIVAFSERTDRLRIISARVLTQRERRQYEETKD